MRITVRMLSPLLAALLGGGLVACGREAATPAPEPFTFVEATIPGIQSALLGKRITTVELVRGYLARVKAYNGACVKFPDGPDGRIEPIADAGQINALSTLNLRPAARRELGFDDRKARSMTDAEDADPAMPDALEIAAAQDRVLAETGKLAGPLHGVVMAVKDQYDTFDMRTTAGADAQYANDRPPDDATFVQRLRAAGAIILAKSNLGEYASPMGRSSFGGVFCNPYDTQRYPGGSSGGSGSSVGANLVTCAIAEETGASIRTPSRHNNAVGISPTQELVSRDGMIGAGIHTRTGPICRNVGDAARVLDAIAGYDPKDPLTAFSRGRKPSEPYAGATKVGSLDGLRIGVVREYMDTSLFTQADEPAIALIESAVRDLATLGATVVDPGPGGTLMQSCLEPQLVDAFGPALLPKEGKPPADAVLALLEMRADPAKLPQGYSLRDLGPVNAPGEGRWFMERYLRERGDANIRSVADLATKAHFFDDPGFAPSADRRDNLLRVAAEKKLSMDERMQRRHAIQQMVLQCFAAQQLDAIVYPTGNVPPPILGQPYEPNVNGRNGGSSWNLLGQQGFPIVVVPAGFTTEVFDRERDPQAPGGSRLVGPRPAALPIGMDILGPPFTEPVLLRIAAAYEAKTHHRRPPPGFGELSNVRGAP
jgi:Asp-tRNA(Asn)/Glu-tRNA(Gln) amidotransferase A subunit family amidase